MKYQRIQKDIKKRNKFLKQELRQLLNLSMSNNTLLTNKIRKSFALKVWSIGQSSSVTRIKNRCVLTGRSKAIYRMFKVSRLMLRQLASNGFVNGVRKASW